jgi:hypothetical protein
VAATFGIQSPALAALVIHAMSEPVGEDKTDDENPA